MLESRAKPASPLVFNQKRRVGQSRRQILISSPLQTSEDVLKRTKQHMFLDDETETAKLN